MCLSGLLTEYNFKEQVASDVGIDDKFLPSTNVPCQDTLNFISNWTKENQMKLNAKKCNYMVFSRSEEKFATRLTVDNVKMESTILGLYLSEDMSWARNCKEICVRAYSRMQMITKLKYEG